MAKPRDGVQARLGWAMGVNHAEDEQVLDWMAQVVREVWDQRYGTEAGGREEETNESEGSGEGSEGESED